MYLFVFRELAVIVELTLLTVLLADLYPLSPCVLPFGPPICAICRVSLDQFLTSEELSRARSRQWFLLQFSFVRLYHRPLSAGSCGPRCTSSLPANSVPHIVAAFIIIIGLHFLGVFRIGFLYREARIQVERKHQVIWWVVMGLAIRFLADALYGPVLASILAVALRQTQCKRAPAGLSGGVLSGPRIPSSWRSVCPVHFMWDDGKFKPICGRRSVMGGCWCNRVLFLTNQSVFRSGAEMFPRPLANC